MICPPNEPRQPTPGVCLAAARASLARRGPHARWAQEHSHIINYLFVITFGLWGAFCVFSVVRGLLQEGWPPWPLVLAAGAVISLLFLAARRLLKLGDTIASIIRLRKVSCWLSLIAPFTAWTLCYCCKLWPCGMPAMKIYLAWHLGFLTSGVLGLLAIVPVLARREYKWIGMPFVGLSLTIPLAALTHHLVYIW